MHPAAMTPFIRSLALLVCAGFLALSLPAYGADKAPPLPTLTVRAGVHPDFDRLVIDWPKPVTYVVHRNGAHVTIEFAAPGQAAWQQVILAHMPRAAGFLSITGKDGHLIISFIVNPKAVVKDFTSDNSVVLDITGPSHGTAQQQEADRTTDNKPAPQPAPAPEMKAAEPAPAPTSAPTPAAPEPAKTVEQTAPVSAAPEPVASAPVATPAPAVAPPVPSIADSILPPSAAPEPVKSVVTPVKPIPFPQMGDGPLLVASLDPHTAVRAAVYERGNYAYIVFDRKLSLDLNALTAGQPASRVTLEPLDLAKASGFRFAVPVDIEIRAARNNTTWQIFASAQHPDVPVSASLVAQPDFALGARYLLPLPDAPEPVHLTDPIIGDDLIVVPLEQQQAFSVARRLADFSIYPAAQGLVIKPLNDKLIVRTVTDGIEITAEGGLHLSTAVDTGAAQESAVRARAAARGKSMFDFTVWHGKTDETFTQGRQRLQQTIVDVPETERNRARLEFARFYFANGNGAEAMALLSYLAKLVPDLTAHADFRALDGASKILAWRPEDALKDFDIPALNNQPEIELWQAVALAEMRDWKSAEEKFYLTESMLAGYPEPFYSRFSILAIESALAQNKDREAADWLDRLESGHHLESAEPAMEYLHGVLDAKSGHAVKAEQAWKDVAKSNDRLYRVRAEMALIDLGVSTRSLTPAHAADRLEALSFAWRREDHELDNLHRLGQIYIHSKNVKSGLNSLARGTQLYPNSLLTPGIHEEMANIFRDVFLSDLGNQLSPLDALTLYQQYRSLMPSGKDGDAVMRNLAERLVAIDLLDQASGLLEELAKNRLQGEEKGRVSARLAAIRLLDHKPQQAIEGLDLANSDTYPPELKNERTLLRAKALSELQKYDDALNLLKPMDTQPSKLLRAEINMRAQRWEDASRTLLELVGSPPLSGSLTVEQADWLVNCAIAASLAGDSNGLDKLRNAYGPSIATLPQNDTFRMLTQPQNTDESHDIAAAQAKITDVDMFQGFLDHYRKAGAAATPPVAPAAANP